MKKEKLALWLLLLFGWSVVRAEEGMWLLPLLKQQNADKLKQMGLMMEVEDIYNPDSTSLKDAIVIFGRGCTGEIISPEGLVLTNHHCGYGAIQQHSTVEHDYLANGFWAMNRNEELPTPGLTIRTIESIEDVTDFVQQEVQQDSSANQLSAFKIGYLEKLARKKMGEEFFKNNPNVDVIIKPFYGGNKFYMFVQNVYKDIRMVGAPPSSIGKFGADTDNWMWPRHTGDFSLFRIYADSLGRPAEYSTKNKPLKPKRYLSISLGGIQEKDFAMIMGFPGTTYRYYTSWEVKQQRDVDNAIRIKMRGVRQKEMLEEMLADPMTRIQYASKYASSSNYWKNSIGMNKGINNLKVIEKKEAGEAAFRKWAKENNKLPYISALDSLQEAVLSSEKWQAQLMLLSEGLMRGIEFSQVPASAAQKLEEALAAKNKDIINKEIENLKEAYRVFANKDYNRKVDRRVAKAMMKAYINEVAPADRPDIFVFIDKKYKGDTDKFIDDAFDKSIFGSDANFDKFVAKPNQKQLQNDLMIKYAKSLGMKLKDIRTATLSTTEAYRISLRNYIKGLLEMNAANPMYPDANSTLRLTYGSVLPYSPSDAIQYDYFTTMDGIMQKEDPNNWEFVVPQKLKELYAKKDFGRYGMKNGKMPVNFLSTNDITGGNSGSPVLNSKGELIGAAFDGNWEAMSGDIIFEPALQRTINVDIRYILFIIDKYAGAKHLIDEMTIVE